MAGSDLDGDLYFVTWHEQLILKKENELPMHFPNAEESHLGRPITELDIINQLKFIVENDDTGRISRRHLIFADLKGIRSDECMRLADLSAQMYDAPKTGVVPKLPRDLKTERAPDFLEKDDHRESYESGWILGKLYRDSKLMLETFSELATQKCTWNLDDDDNCSVTVRKPEEEIQMKEMANVLHESYCGIMKTFMEKYDIHTEISIWRARFRDFKFTDEEKQKHKKLIEDFARLHETMQNLHDSAVQELFECGIKGSDIKHQLYCHCKQLRRDHQNHHDHDQPFCAGLPLMLYDAKPKDRSSDYVYRQTGRHIRKSLKPVFKRRLGLLATNSVQLLVNQDETNSICMFLLHSWLLAVASFLAERLCRPEDDSTCLQQKLHCILPMLMHVIIKLGLCQHKDIVRSKKSVGWMFSIQHKLGIQSFNVHRLTKQLHGFLSSADEDDFHNIGKAAVHTLWDVYTKQETSKEHRYEKWELELQNDAKKMLLKIALRCNFDTPTTASATAT